MASFDLDGDTFVGRCAFDERMLFKNALWGWDGTRKAWTTEMLSRVLPLADLAVGQAKEFLDERARRMRAAVADSWAEDTDFEPPCPEGLAYMPFQKAGIEYAIGRDRVLIADPPGLGKTVQAIGAANVTETPRVLVVCPASLKVNWAREWRRWDTQGLTVGIAMSYPRYVPKSEGGPRTEQVYDWPDTDVVICNYDMLEAFDEQIKGETWPLVILDEAHNLKTADAIRTMCVFGGYRPRKKVKGITVKRAQRIRPLKAGRMIFLTGTPILSNPAELWTLIEACDPEGLGKNFKEFAYRYCDAWEGQWGFDATGSTNPEELAHILRARFMVRRDKRAVLKELPDKRRELIVLPQDKLEKPVKKERTRIEAALAAFEEAIGIESTEGEFRYIQIIDDLCAKIGKALDRQGDEKDWDKAIASLSGTDQIAFTEISAAREEVALAKVGLIVEHVMSLRKAGEPVILFAYHKSVIDELVLRFEKAGEAVGVVTGNVSSAIRRDGTSARQNVIDAFQEGRIDIIIGNILAMGVGFTLTRASHVVFGELDWVPALIEQAEDRAWRHGQKNAVLVQHLVVDGSIEARMAEALLAKMLVIAASLDSSVDDVIKRDIVFEMC